ncbi:carboxylesterase/lipase family protein [Streptosporangium sp. CA-135522]|uniref:carboxylesterase/lipase family protein n=1 Tax=Streptosporangium sp. CA-135522 TaxID=3240072 RepID=UPI003D8D9F94
MSRATFRAMPRAASRATFRAMPRAVSRATFRATAVVSLAAALALGGCAGRSTAQATGPSGTACTTTTSLGAVEGRTEKGICAFRGIPYADAPTGKQRFKPPRPAGAWRGTLKATDGTRVCPQFPDRQGEEYPDGRKVYTDEDCLYLNVWTPKADHGRRPVIVFIHGGAATFGTGNEARYAGTTLAAKGDAVVVSLNYRLGVLGWTELGGLDPAYRGSGNNGLRDQMTALAWVREHVADFGGDPGNVTAVGESEGAFSIGAMLGTDHPERLFRRVILQSGTGYMAHSASLSAKLTPRGLDLPALRSMSTQEILRLQEKLLGALPGAAARAVYFGPAIDGELVRGPVLQRVAAGHARGIDIIAGSNRDEMRYFAQFDPSVLKMTLREYGAFFPRELGKRRQHMIAAYRAGRPGASESDIALAMLTDQGLRVPATRLAEAQSRWAKTYLYRFDWEPGNDRSLGAIHTAELPFMFGTLRFVGVPGGQEALRADRARVSGLSDQMVEAWTSFARTGDPNAGRTVSRPAWPRHTPAERRTMIWDTPAKVVDAPREKERALWDGFGFPGLDLNL